MDFSFRTKIFECHNSLESQVMLSIAILQINFDSHLKIVAEMTEIGETVERVDALIKDTKRFQKMCDVDIERAEEVIAIGKCNNDLSEFVSCAFSFLIFYHNIVGQQLISVRGACPKEVVQPKCDELSRVCDIVTDRLSRRLEILLKSRDLMERVEKVCNAFCHRIDTLF